MTKKQAEKKLLKHLKDYAGDIGRSGVTENYVTNGHYAIKRSLLSEETNAVLDVRYKQCEVKEEHLKQMFEVDQAEHVDYDPVIILRDYPNDPKSSCMIAESLDDSEGLRLEYFDLLNVLVGDNAKKAKPSKAVLFCVGGSVSAICLPRRK